MSDVANEYVRGLAKKKTGPDGKPLTRAELRVLKALAWQHNEFVWCAWPKLKVLATEIQMSESYCRETIAGLVVRGVLRRFFAVSEKYGESTSNEYEFVALGEGHVSQETRDVVFKYRRVRAAVQIPLRRGGRQRKQVAQAAGEAASTEADGSPTAAGPVAATDEQAAGEAGLAAAEGSPAAAVSVERVAPHNGGNCPGQRQALPSELYGELYLTGIPLLTAPLGIRSVENIAKSADHEQKPKRATAKTTATTSSLRAPVDSTESVDGVRASSAPGFRVAGRVIPFRQQRPAREPRNVDEARDQLDGEEAALFDEAVRVLIAAGRPRDLITRSERKVVIAQLRSYVARKSCTIHDAGRVASDMWQQYLDANDAGLLFRPVGIKAFIGEALWLGKDRWHYDAVAVRESRLMRRL